MFQSFCLCFFIVFFIEPSKTLVQNPESSIHERTICSPTFDATALLFKKKTKNCFEECKHLSH